MHTIYVVFEFISDKPIRGFKTYKDAVKFIKCQDKNIELLIYTYKREIPSDREGIQNYECAWSD